MVLLAVTAVPFHSTQQDCTSKIIPRTLYVCTGCGTAVLALNCMEDPGTGTLITTSRIHNFGLITRQPTLCCARLFLSFIDCKIF